jgi:hypothetical protein
MLSTALLSVAVLAAANAGAQSDPPIACQPQALSPTERKRQQALLEIVQKRIQATQELSNGFAIRLPSERDTFMDLAEWISLEHRCCPFVEFSLEWKRDDSVWVRLTGGPGVKEALAAEMEIGAGR